MAEKQWEVVDVWDFSQAPLRVNMTFGERTPYYGKEHEALLYNNSDIVCSVGGYNNSKQTNYKENNDNAHEDYENRYNGKHKFGGRNRQQDSDGPHHGNNRGGDNDRKWQSNWRNQYDGETEDVGFNGHDRPRRDIDDRDGRRGRRGGGDGRNRDNDDNDFEDRKPRKDRSDRGESIGRGGRRDDGYGRNRKNSENNNFENSGHKWNDDEWKELKKNEICIPPEQLIDESFLFENEVTMGMNFNEYNVIEVKVTGEGAPHPIKSFDQSGLRTDLLQNIKKSGYTEPTPVQKYAIPIIMSGRDLMACAQTDSDKNAAFVLPILHSLLENQTDLVKTGSSCEPHAIIISPTRKLALQTYLQFKKFSLNSIIHVEMIYEEMYILYQTNEGCNGCHVLIATPAMLWYFIRQGKVVLSSLRFFVLDELDEMLDMRFLPYIEKIIDDETMVATEERQMLMFSATFSNEIQKLADRFLQNYLFLEVRIVGDTCADVQQNFYQISGKSNKLELLIELLGKENKLGSIQYTLVFVSEKIQPDFIASFLSERNYRSAHIDEDKFQRKREEALFDFKQGKMPILVLTTLAARSLDIKNVSHVINFNLPQTIDEYIDRIRQTSRVGNRGKVTSFFNPEFDIPLAGDLIKILKQAGQAVPDLLKFNGGGESENYFMPGKGRKFGGEDIRAVKMAEQQREIYFLKIGGDACADVEQNFYEVSGPTNKRKLLIELLRKQNKLGSIQGTLVFVSAKIQTNFIAFLLSEKIIVAHISMKIDFKENKKKHYLISSKEKYRFWY
ncbi:ATP-dependent RNA helicase vasa [Solenopsis invicta]|uniref:ATP-dependent RNA helicase vasa n=1 Tax=Solenopsis invicta TaxID=13686 RepID=UPI00193EB72F|nr:ATP-dependent RNA helicase vasa [Solenopsis invicta]